MEACVPPPPEDVYSLLSSVGEIVISSPLTSHGARDSIGQWFVLGYRPTRKCSILCLFPASCAGVSLPENPQPQLLMKNLETEEQVRVDVHLSAEKMAVLGKERLLHVEDVDVPQEMEDVLLPLVSCHCHENLPMQSTFFAICGERVTPLQVLELRRESFSDPPSFLCRNLSAAQPHVDELAPVVDTDCRFVGVIQLVPSDSSKYVVSRSEIVGLPGVRMYKSLLDATFSSLPPCEDEYGYEELKKLLMLPFFSDAFKEALESFDEGIILVDKLPAFPREFMDILMEQLQAAFNLALLGDAFDNIQLTLAVLRLFYYLCYNKKNSGIYLESMSEEHEKFITNGVLSFLENYPSEEETLLAVSPAIAILCRDESIQTKVLDFRTANGKSVAILLLDQLLCFADNAKVLEMIFFPMGNVVIREELHHDIAAWNEGNLVSDVCQLSFNHLEHSPRVLARACVFFGNLCLNEEIQLVSKILAWREKEDGSSFLSMATKALVLHMDNAFLVERVCFLIGNLLSSYSLDSLGNMQWNGHHLLHALLDVMECCIQDERACRDAMLALYQIFQGSRASAVEVLCQFGNSGGYSCMHRVFQVLHTHRHNVTVAQDALFTVHELMGEAVFATLIQESPDRFFGGESLLMEIFNEHKRDPSFAAMFQPMEEGSPDL